MDQDYRFKKLTDVAEVKDLKKEWLESVLSPPDGMWEYFRNSANHWSIIKDGKAIGYADIDDNRRLLQFYIKPEYLSKGELILKKLIEERQIKTGIVGTNNPIYLSLALHFAEKHNIHTYLFRDYHEVNIEEKEGTLKECQKEDFDSIVHFCHQSMGAPKEWLAGYIGELISDKEIFSFKKDNKIIGTCEVRNSATAAGFADIGMVISPDFRRKGYGTFLLHQAKTIAVDRGKTPICSCEKDNIGSLKAIQSAGFFSLYQLLQLTFSW